MWYTTPMRITRVPLSVARAGIAASRLGDWLPAALAALAFVAFAAAFCWELFAYQHKVVEWARGDLQARADLAAAHLEEPLRTQDFRKVREFGDKCKAEGYRLSVFDANGHGRVFDTFRNPELDPPQFSADQKCGDEYLVRLWIPVSRVLKPFWRALIGIVLAGLVGMAGVLLFFFVTYRQRVHIRELKRIERFRRDFIADVSHEIRTPLTGILGAVDLLEDGSPLVPLIRRESRRLNLLVQSILDLARLEREGDVLNRVETDLSDLVKETAARYSCQVAAEGPCVVSCDPQLVSQALANLIENAFRHSGSKDVRVSLDICGESARIHVEDRGIGIPPEERERIFERFHRLDPARATETGGAGLGLAIVRRIARLHGGDVTVTDARPNGARFTFSIKMV